MDSLKKVDAAVAEPDDRVGVVKDLVVSVWTGRAGLGITAGQVARGPDSRHELGELLVERDADRGIGSL